MITKRKRILLLILLLILVILFGIIPLFITTYVDCIQKVNVNFSNGIYHEVRQVRYDIWDSSEDNIDDIIKFIQQNSYLISREAKKIAKSEYIIKIPYGYKEKTIFGFKFSLGKKGFSWANVVILIEYNNGKKEITRKLVRFKETTLKIKKQDLRAISP